MWKAALFSTNMGGVVSPIYTASVLATIYTLLRSPVKCRHVFRVAALLYCALPPARSGQPIAARHYDAVSIISTTLFPVHAARRYY